MTPSPELIVCLRRIITIGLVTGGIGAAVLAFGFVRVNHLFYAAYLIAFIEWLSLSLGCMGIAMIHGMTGGGWGKAIRRVIEAGYETIPLMAILFIPIWLGAPLIYQWVDPDFMARDPILIKKSGYLNLRGFQWRAIIAFLVWAISVATLNLYSPNESDVDSPRARRLQQVSGLGFMAFGFTWTIAIVDWAMSLEPKWYSTMYALVHLAGQGVAGLAFAIIVVVALRRFEPWSTIVTADRVHDLGNLMLASVMFWAYCSFFQFLVIWSGNLPEENFWYVHRSRNGWQAIAVSLFLLHFAVPFLLLLSRPLKRDGRSLQRIAMLLLMFHFVDLFWIVAPGFQWEDAENQWSAMRWLTPVAFSSIGGFWVSVFAWRLLNRIRRPNFDSRLETAYGQQRQFGTT